MSTAYEEERALALKVVAEASGLARTFQTTLVSNPAQTKVDASPVTIADYAVQAHIVHYLQTAFPNDHFIAEETPAALEASPSLLSAVAKAASLSPDAVLTAISACAYPGADDSRTWILDPIDGTRGYIAMRQYCIALAFSDASVVRLGVLGCPSLPLDSLAISNSEIGCLFHAVRGDGTWMVSEKKLTEATSPRAIIPHIGVPCYVSDVADPVWSVFCESVETGHSSHELSARVANFLGVAAPPVRMDSQAKYGCMARGDASIFLRFPRKGYVENIWDSAPACIIVEEAGGRVTDGRGRPLDFSLGRKMDNDDGIVATNGLVHDAVIAAVQKAMKEARM